MTSDKLDALERLTRLRDAGALSEAEFQAEKAILLQGSATAPLAGTESVPAEIEPFPSGRTEQRATVPVWARKKRSMGITQVVGLLCALFVVTFAATMWVLNREGEPARSFMVTGPANVRNSPTAEGSNIVGKLAEGDFIVGRAEGETEWVEIVEGPQAGKFVWAGNLVTEGPDEALEIDNGPSGSVPALDPSSLNPQLARMMRNNAVPQRPWRAVTRMESRHQGSYGRCTPAGFGVMFADTATGAFANGQLVGAKPFTELYQAGDRYIWSTGESYFVADLLRGEMIMRDALGNVSAGTERAMKCTGAADDINASTPPASPTPRAVLFTPQGITNSEYLGRADCPSVVAARAALTCSAQILGSMPNASYGQRVRTAYAAANQQSHGRCRAEFARTGQISEVAAQRALGDVYPAVADAAVYGGDVSEQAIAQCIRNAVGRMAGAGLR